NPTISAQQDRRGGRTTTASASSAVISAPPGGRTLPGRQWGTGPIPISTPTLTGTGRRDHDGLHPGRGLTRTWTPVSSAPIGRRAAACPAAAGQAARSLAAPPPTRSASPTLRGRRGGTRSPTGPGGRPRQIEATATTRRPPGAVAGTESVAG